MARIFLALAFSFFANLAHAAGSVSVILNAEMYSANGPGVSGCGLGKTALEAAQGCIGAYEAANTSRPSSSNCQWSRTSVVVKPGSDQITPWMVITWTGSSIPGLGTPCTSAPQEDWVRPQVGKVFVNVCPANALGSPSSNPTSCSCKAGYVADAAGKACIPDCTANQTLSSGWYDVGPNQGASPQLLGCKGLCEVVFDGTSPAGSSMVDGKKHWYAKGEYVATGAQCSAAMADKPIGTGTPTKPEDTCAPGEAKGTVNGKTVCVKQSGEDAGKPTEDSNTKDKETKETKTETNPDGSVTTTETTVKIGADGKKETTIKRTTTKPDGSTSTDSETTTQWPPAGSDDGGEEGEEGEEIACEKNPSGEGCGGNPATIGGLYAPKDKTMAGVLSAHSSAVMASAFGGAVGGFFSVSGGGTCPTWNAHIPFLDADLSIDQFCSGFAQDALAILKIAILLGASFFAFRVAVE